MKIARLIVTFDCLRDCSFCVNKNQSILDQAKRIEFKSLPDLQSYDLILITGGEPMLKPETTKAIISRLRFLNPVQLIYLYSSIPIKLGEFLDHVNGMTYTIHKGSNPSDLGIVQSFLQHHPNRSYRLNIDPEFRADLKIKPYLWDKIKIKKWYDSKMVAIPKDETLYILEEE